MHPHLLAMFSKKILTLLFLVLLLGCKKTDFVDPQLVGVWTDYSGNLYIKNDKTYALVNFYDGGANNTVKIDSTFGVYEVDKKRKNITFYQNGYREKPSGVIQMKKGNPLTWTYSIVSDTLLKYETNSLKGEMYKDN